MPHTIYTIARIIILVIRLMVLLVPALRNLPAPRKEDVVKLARMVWPYLKQVRFSTDKLAETERFLRKLVKWVKEHQALIIRLATLAKSVVAFIINLIKVIRTAFTKVVAKAVATVLTVVKVLRTKLW